MNTSRLTIATIAHFCRIELSDCTETEKKELKKAVAKLNNAGKSIDNLKSFRKAWIYRQKDDGQEDDFIPPSTQEISDEQVWSELDKWWKAHLDENGNFQPSNVSD